MTRISIQASPKRIRVIRLRDQKTLITVQREDQWKMKAVLRVLLKFGYAQQIQDAGMVKSCG